MNYFERIIDISTGDETIRNYEPKEIEDVEKEMLRVQQLNDEAKLNETNRQSALAKLTALGLTPEEIAAL
jgi:hypothetical protein